ncbi:MAG: ATP-dependent helicase [Bariatricus sp.]|nr:ATP-dependent helicase [Bariatricus sp.]
MLNKGQEEAVHHGEGPCMVLAPPGSGKTLTITRRTQYLIEEANVSPDQILVITFTRLAAREMRDRFKALTEGKNYPVTFGTFHSVYYGILKCAYGIGGNNLLSEQEGLQILKLAFEELKLESLKGPDDDEDLAQELMQEIGIVKNSLLHLKDFHSQYLDQEEFALLFREYEKKKKERKKFDFDDMLVQCYALFQKRPDILKGWQERFTYILVDEFQDINRVQYEVIRMLAAPEYNLFVVGDDDQSIYGFRGAKPELMMYMKQEFPNLRQIPLTTNYRSTEYIVGAASRVILHNESRFYKRVKAAKGQGDSVHVQEVLDENEESRYVAGEIRKKLDAGQKPGEIAVLFRAGIQARMLTEILNEYRIPFEMKEHIPNFYHHFIVRDMIAYMQLAAGSRERRWFLMIGNRPLRYLSRSSMENPKVQFEDLRKFYLDKDWMQDKIDQFEVDIKMMENMAPYASIQYIRKRIGYDDFLKDYAKERQIPWSTLEQVMKELEERCKPYRTFQDWMGHVESYTKELEEQEKSSRSHQSADMDKVQLMTMHSSKGLEFSSVFIIHANEGEVPYLKATRPDELEEERRMFYVAMTRAKENLTISYISEKNGSPMRPSRFVEELLGRHL